MKYCSETVIFAEADPYVYIKCEGYKGKSGIVKSCLDPKWDFSVLFYRKKPEKPIKIQVGLLMKSQITDTSFDRSGTPT